MQSRMGSYSQMLPARSRTSFKLHAQSLCNARAASLLLCRSSSQPVMTLDIMDQATSLTRMAQILDECAVSNSDPQVAAIAIDKLAMMGTDVASGDAEAFKLLRMEERVQDLCEAAALASKASQRGSDMSFHVVADALAGLMDLSRGFDALCDHPAVQGYANTLVNVAMSNWPKWKAIQDASFYSIQDLACLLDSIAFFCPVRTSASDDLTTKVVMEVEATLKSGTSRSSASISDFAGLCYGVWALAAYYGNRNLLLQPRLTVACAAEVLQLDHPSNTSANQGLYTSDGALSHQSARQTVLPDAVINCLDEMCRLIKSQAMRQTNAGYLLRDKDAVVKILAGISLLNSPTTTSQDCMTALIRICVREMQQQAREENFYPMSPLLPVQNTAITAAAIAHMGTITITSSEAIRLCMSISAIYLSARPPGSLQLPTVGSSFNSLPSYSPDDSMDLVSQVSLLKSMIRLGMLPPRESLMAAEPHWVAVSSEVCTPAQEQALAELPEILLQCHHVPGPALVDALCRAVLKSRLPIQAKARQILCIACEAPVAAQPAIRLCLEDYVTQLYTQGVLARQDSATQFWTLNSLLDAAMLVYSHLWVQLHHLAAEIAVHDGFTGSPLLHTLRFSQCMRVSLTCSFPPNAGHTPSSPRSTSVFEDCLPERTLSPGICLYPGKGDVVREAAMIRSHLVSSCSTGTVKVVHDLSWQDMMALEPPVSACTTYSNDDVHEQGKEHYIFDIDSVYLSSEPWLRSCMFVAYTFQNEATSVVEHGRVVLVLTPPHLELEATLAAEGGLPWAFGSCSSSSAPIRRLGALLNSWRWPTVTIVGRTWRTLVDASQQQGQRAKFRKGIHGILSRLVNA